MNKQVVEEEEMVVEKEEVEEYVDPKELSEKDLIRGHDRIIITIIIQL